MYSHQSSSPQQCLCSSTLRVHDKDGLSIMVAQTVRAHLAIEYITCKSVPEHTPAHHQLVCGFSSVPCKPASAVWLVAKLCSPLCVHDSAYD